MVFPVISPFSHIYSLTVDGKHADHVSCALHHELASKSIFNLESNKIEVFKFFLLLGMYVTTFKRIFLDASFQ